MPTLGRGGVGGKERRVKFAHLVPKVAACWATPTGAWLPPSDARAGRYGATLGAVSGLGVRRDRPRVIRDV